MSPEKSKYRRPGSEATGITRELAAWATDVSLPDVDAATRDFAVDVLLDTVASALAGTHGVESGMVRRLAEAVGGPGDATVVGGGSLSPAGAALVNGYLITAVTICDVHKPLLCHVTPEVVPPALAVAEREHSSGADLLAAIVVGAEVTIRIGLGLDYGVFRARGWHSPGVIGPFGGAAAVARLLGLDEVGMRNALGLAGSQAGGTFAHWGTPTIKFHQSRGALSGLLAGLLAAEGLASSPDVLTHADGGLLFTHSDGGRPEMVVEGLGSRWRFDELTLRRWPLSSGLQSLITALSELLVAHDLVPDDIALLRVDLPPEIHEMYADFPWDSKFQAHLSPRFLASVVAHDRRAWLDQFEPDRRGDPAVGDFAHSRVRLESDPSIAGEGCRVTVTTTGGDEHVNTCLTPVGDPVNRLPRDDVVEKFHDARAGLIDDATAERVLEGLLHIEDVDDVAPLIALLRGGTRT